MANVQVHEIRRPEVLAPGAFGGIFAALRLSGSVAVIDTLLRWRERASQRTRLGELDDRLLSDIGISRAAAAREASKPFWKA